MMATLERRLEEQAEWYADAEKRKEYLRRSPNPIIHNSLRLNRMDGWSREDALELALCYMAQENAQQFEMLCALVNRYGSQELSKIMEQGT
jgi:hypothetical protein